MDDSSCYSWLFPVKRKSEVFDIFVKFQSYVDAFLTQKSSVFNLIGEANIAHYINNFNKMALLTDYLVLIPISKIGLLKENIDILSKLD